jgi:hypothetical protein
VSASTTQRAHNTATLAVVDCRACSRLAGNPCHRPGHNGNSRPALYPCGPRQDDADQLATWLGAHAHLLIGSHR